MCCVWQRISFILSIITKTNAFVATHLGANNNPASKTAFATVPTIANKMALTPSTVLSTSLKMMVMFSGWLSRVWTHEEQEASGCQHDRFILLALVFVVNHSTEKHPNEDPQLCSHWI